MRFLRTIKNVSLEKEKKNLKIIAREIEKVPFQIQILFNTRETDEKCFNFPPLKNVLVFFHAILLLFGLLCV